MGVNGGELIILVSILAILISMVIGIIALVRRAVCFRTSNGCVSPSAGPTTRQTEGTQMGTTVWGLSATAWTAIYTLLTAGLLAIAVVAAIYAARQWSASKEQIADARRAQVEASPPYAIATVEPSQASRALFDLSVRNIGHRPAINVRVHFDPPPSGHARPTTSSRSRTSKCLANPLP